MVKFMKKLVSKIELSRVAGVSPAAISKAIRAKLAVAMSGKRIDINHPVVVEYIEQQSKPPPPPPPKKKSKPPPPPPKKPEIKPGVAHTKDTKKSLALEKLNDDEKEKFVFEIPENITKFIDYTLRELIHQFGTDAAFYDWLKATKEIENINEKRLKNAATQGELVHRGLVKQGIVDPINATHSKLLTDGSKTIARRVTAMFGAGRSVEECEKFVAETIESFIRPMKTKITKALKQQYQIGGKP